MSLETRVKAFLDLLGPDIKNINSNISALLFRAINAQTGTSYTLVSGDTLTWITMSNASASTLTVPPNSSVAFPIGTQIEGSQQGVGQVTIVAGAGVTIDTPSGLKVGARYGVFGLKKIATNEWVAYGKLVP